MLNYDFKILHSNEFECFTRDLLQASEHLRIESFAEGRDGGIDLRFAYDSTKQCIVQCKRYKDWNELKNSLKKEVAKVKNLNPDRYIISTSVDLTAKNKDEIKELFTPYIKDTANDILGQSDLNNLLGQHREIERQYYKLWLGSTNVLESILHKNVVNWSDFELDTIKSEISKYVQNDSFTKAQMILQAYRYVIISGIPGIGKTTLARMLVFYYLANDYEEFVYIVDDLDKACELYDKNKKQVFFFDDFLGSNFFVQQSVSFENKLISFINRIKKSSNTLFIMTTREYILSDAKNYYEKIDLNKIDIAKCTIDLSNYTEIVRARILYNHLAEAQLPKEYINALVDNKNYEKIIKLPNFNPRVIESFINQKIWNDISPENFMSTVIDFFDNPLSVWEKAFENLNPFARYALLVFATFGGRTLLEEWREAFKYFCETTNKDLGLVYDDILWKRTVKILQDCFIQINTKVVGSIIIIPFNPSIMDFCVSYISDSNNKTTLPLLLKSVFFPEQLTSIYTDGTINPKSLKWQVKLPTKFFQLIGGVIIKLKERKSLGVETVFYEALLDNIPSLFQLLDGFIEKNFDFQELMSPSIPISQRLKMIRIIDWNRIQQFSPLYILQQYIDIDNPYNFNNILDMDAYDWRDLLETIDTLGFSSILSEKAIRTINEQIEIENDNMNNYYDCERLGSFIYDISRLLFYNEHLSMSYDKIIEKKSQFIDELEMKNEQFNITSHNNVVQNEDNNTIHEMFTSLYDNH